MSKEDIVISNAKPEDIVQLTDLWRDVFGDPETFIKGFYDCIDIKSGVIAAYDGARLVGMLNAVPVYLNGTDFEGKYLYAVCVDSRYRGSGIFRRMMKEAERDTDFVVLVPQNESVEEAYRRMGYTDVISLPDAVAVASESIPDLRPYDGDSDRLYAAYLCGLADGEIVRGRDFFAFSLKDTLKASNGAEIYYITGDRGDIGYLIGDLKERTLKIYEISCEKPEISAIIKGRNISRGNALMKRLSGGIAVPANAYGLLDM